MTPSDTAHPEGETGRAEEFVLKVSMLSYRREDDLAGQHPADYHSVLAMLVGRAKEIVALSTRPSRPQGEEAIGPRAVDRVTCEGCPAFKSEWWQEHLDNDETDSGTRAECTAASKYITSYWSPKGAPPTWCPALSNQGKPSS